MKSYGHFCQILALFMMPAHQMWSCRVTQDANFENFLFCPNSTFNIRKVTKFPVEILSNPEVISKKPHGVGWVGGKHPSPVPLGLTICFVSQINQFELILNAHTPRSMMIKT